MASPICGSCSQHVFDGDTIVHAARERHFCPVCVWAAPDCKSLVVHWRLSGHVFVCKGCAAGFISNTELELHRFEAFSCKICHKHHVTAEDLEAHASIQLYVCKTCGIQSCTLDAFRAHMEALKHDSFCFGCNEQYPSSRDLTTHLASEGVEACNTCHVHSADLEELDLRSHQTWIHFRCPTCLMQAFNIEGLNQHFNETGHAALCRDEERRAVCEDNEELNNHLLRNVSCLGCYQHFHDRTTLKHEHLEQEYACQVCNVHHHLEEGLVRHRLTSGHLLKCPQCPTTASQEDVLAFHQARTHDLRSGRPITDSNAPGLPDTGSSIGTRPSQTHEARAPSTTRPDISLAEPSRDIMVRFPGHSERASLHADLDMPDAQDHSNNTEKCKSLAELAGTATQGLALPHNVNQGLYCKSCNAIFMDRNEFSLHVTLNNVCFGCNQHHDSPEYLVRHCLNTGHAHLCRGCWNVGMHGLFSTAQELQTHAVDAYCCGTCSRHHSSLYELTVHCVDTSHNCICKGCDRVNHEIQGAMLRQHFPQNFTCLECHNHHQDFPAYAEHCDKTGHVSMCFGCLAKFESIDLFRGHLGSKHACLKCHIHFPDFEFLRSHFIVTGHAPSCRSCRAVFQDDDQLNTHLEQLLTCMQCHIHHDTNVDLMRHCRDTGHPVPIKTEPSGDFTHDDNGLEPDSNPSSEDSPQQLVNHAVYNDLIVNCCNCGNCKNNSVMLKTCFCSSALSLASASSDSSANNQEKAKDYHGGRLLDLCRCPACDRNFATLPSLFSHLERKARENRGNHAVVVRDIIGFLGWTLKAPTAPGSAHVAHQHKHHAQGMVNNTSAIGKPVVFTSDNGTASRHDLKAEIDCPISVCKKKIPLRDLWAHISGRSHSSAALEARAMRRLLDLPDPLAFCEKGVKIEVALLCSEGSKRKRRDGTRQLKFSLPRFLCPVCHTFCNSPKNIFAHWNKCVRNGDQDHIDKLQHLKAELRGGV